MSVFTNHLPPEGWATSDVTITQVLDNLRAQHTADKAIYLEAGTLIKILDALFDRKTFRHEPEMEKCTTHNWEMRLHSALKTQRVLQIYSPNIKEKGSVSQQIIYSEILRWLNDYIECMAGFLFRKKINYADLQAYIGSDKCEPFLRKFIPNAAISQLAPDDLSRMNHSLQETIRNADELFKSL